MHDDHSNPAAPEHADAARAYLASELGPRAPQTLRFEAAFDEQPLEGEGRTELYSFDLAAGGGAAACPAEAARHFVAVGETTPNYFPAYGLSADDAFSLHVGTRFMLTMQIGLTEPTLEPPGARAALHTFLATHLRGVAAGPEELAALFRCEDDFFAVYRLTIDGRPLYFMGADCPPGFCDLADHPPQAALRLHLGRLIRREARSAGP